LGEIHVIPPKCERLPKPKARASEEQEKRMQSALTLESLR
jgi:hypothetical protein